MSNYLNGLKDQLRDIRKLKDESFDCMQRDQQRYQAARQAEAGIVALLKLEGFDPDADGAKAEVASTATPNQSKNAVLAISKSVPKLPDLLKEALADGKPRGVPELIEVAKSRGIDFGPKDPAKAVNFTLMGIANGKTIQRIADKWQRVPA
jgi:hypothetical protein